MGFCFGNGRFSSRNQHRRPGELPSQCRQPPPPPPQVYPDGTHALELADGSYRLTDGTLFLADGSIKFRDGTIHRSDGSTEGSGTPTRNPNEVSVPHFQMA